MSRGLWLCLYRIISAPTAGNTRDGMACEQTDEKQLALTQAWEGRGERERLRVVQCSSFNPNKLAKRLFFPPSTCRISSWCVLLKKSTDSSGLTGGEKKEKDRSPFPLHPWIKVGGGGGDKANKGPGERAAVRSLRGSGRKRGCLKKRRKEGWHACISWRRWYWWEKSAQRYKRCRPLLANIPLPSKE